MLRPKHILLATLAWLLGTTSASAGLPGLDNPDYWRLREVTWADKGGVPIDSQFSQGLSAHYNLAYGTTVLGVTTRVPDDNHYYAVVASCEDSQLTTLDYMGPFNTAPTWHSGPYHVAAGLPDGRLVVWLTAPGEFPVPLTASWNYIPGTPFSCQAYPPEPPAKRWQDWTATVAYEVDPDNPGIAVITIDGIGRVIAGLDILDLSNHLAEIHLREYTFGEYIIPGLLIYSGASIYSAWHHPTWGWRAEKLSDSRLDRVRLWLSPGIRQPGALAIFNDNADILDVPVLQQINLAITAETGITARWGKSAKFDQNYEYDETSFIDTVQLVWPLIAQSTGTDIWLSYHYQDPRAKPGSLVFKSALLHTGERGIIGSEEVALHPVLSISGASHWNTGTPEIFWVQLGGGRLYGEGALYQLEYVATEQYD